MPTQEVKLMVGIPQPGSGKSTWVEQEVARIEEERRTTCVISRDYIREQMLQDGETYFAREDEVFNEFIRQINEAMEIGFDVVFVDATHINYSSRDKVLSKLLPDPRTNLTFEVMNTKASLAIERNAQREGFAKVPESAIKHMACRFKFPGLDEIPTNKYGFKNVKIIIHKEGDAT